MSVPKAFVLACALVAMLREAGSARSLSVSLPGSSSRIDAIKKRGMLRVATLEEYPWLTIVGHGNDARFSGPAWILAEQFAQRLGVRLATVPVRFEDKVPIVMSRLVDMTIAPLLDTPDRRKDVDFIDYSTSAQCFFGLADNAVVSLATRVDDLNHPHVTVGYVAGLPQGPG